MNLYEFLIGPFVQYGFMTRALVGATIYALLGLSAVMAGLAYAFMPVLIRHVLIVPPGVTLRTR